MSAGKFIHSALYLMKQNTFHFRSGVGAGQLFMLDPWEEVPLAVIPSRSSVVLPQTQQQVQ